MTRNFKRKRRLTDDKRRVEEYVKMIELDFPNISKKDELIKEEPRNVFF